MRSILLVGLSLLVALCAGQTTGGAPPRVKPKAAASAQHDTRPVTEAEAHTTFARMREVLGKGLRSRFPSTPRVGSSGRPVTREQVVGEFDSVLAALRPAIKFVPNAVAFSPTVVRIGSSQRARLLNLIKLGFVARVGPLATGPTDTMTVHEFGDAMGFFMARMAQLTHLPSPKWTPALGAGRG